MAKVRILRIQSRICVGGPALNAIFLSAFLPVTTYRTLLVGGRLDHGEKSMVPRATDEGVAVHELAEMGRSIRWVDDLKALIKLIRLIRYYRPHIVHTHTAKAGALGRVAAFLCRVPVRVHTFHGHVFHGYFSARKSRLFVWIERFLAMLCHRVIVISPRQFDDIVGKYKVVSEKKARIVRLGFQLDHLMGGEKGVFRKSIGVGAQTTLVGIVARLVPIKNHVLLLEAIGHWTRRSHGMTPEDVRFLIIGDGESRPDLEAKVAELDIADWVVFAGWRSDLPEIYADLNLNVLVSKNEGTPVTLIEGLACGVPILTTDVGGIRDFADGDCGTIVPADIDGASLADHLDKRIGAAQQTGRLPESIRQRVVETFHVNRLVADVDRLYREAIPEKVWHAIRSDPELKESLAGTPADTAKSLEKPG